MRSAIASIAVVTLLVCAFLWLASATPAPYSDAHRVFTRTDQIQMEIRYPGGYYPNARTYVFCSPVNERWGETVLMRADGSTAWLRTTCWRLPRGD